MDLIEKIQQLLDEKYTSDEMFADCFTVEVELKPPQRLYVFVDSDSSMTFDKCKKLSRHLESYIDTNGWLGEKYLLEVSSPGITRPLKFIRQYIKNVGRTLEVVTNEGVRHISLLKAADEEKIVLWEEIVEKEGKKKVKREVETAIPYDQIQKATIKVSFK
jgi:ribosome maturation factor RimP